MSAISLLTSVVGIVNFAYAIYFQYYLVDIPESVSKTRNLFGGPWKFLTFINLWIQLFYFLASFLNGLFGTEVRSRAKSSRLQSTRDWLFASLAFPIGMFVGVMFWGLFFINRDLVFPAKYDAYIPAFENHLLHTTVIPLQLIELLTVFHVYPPRTKGMMLTALFCFGYLTWICYIAYVGGFWVYPVFKVLTPVKRVGFMVVCAAFGALLYFTGEVAHYILWGPSQNEKKRA